MADVLVPATASGVSFVLNIMPMWVAAQVWNLQGNSNESNAWTRLAAVEKFTEHRTH